MPPTRRRPPAGRPQRPAQHPSRRPPAGGRPRPRPPVRAGRRIAGALALLVITVSGLGHAAVNGVNDAINRVDAFGGMQGRPNGSKGTNYLLVGTDDRDDVAPADRRRYHLGGVACHCTDTILLVHVSQDRRRATFVSIPRDTYVRLPGAARGKAAATAPAAPGNRPPGRAPQAHGQPGRALPGAGQGAGAPADTASVRPAETYPTHPAKINEAYADGGPKLTVRTVEQMTGVHIDHYVEVDFVSFMKTVDVLGGVPVCTPKPLRDPFSGLDLPAGTTTLDGGRALQYVRSRHLDGAADLGRMQRQQRFLAEVISRITSGGTLRDPVALSGIARTVLGSVRTDQGLRPTDLITLAEGMRGFSPHTSEFVQVPLSTVGYNVPGVGSTVKWDERRAGRLWAALRADRPLTDQAGPGQSPGASARDQAHGKDARPRPTVAVDPRRIRVAVENGTTAGGLAATAQKELAAIGFITPVPPATAPLRTGRTVISYDPRWDDSVKSLAAALPGAELHAVRGQGPVMRVTLGADFTKVTPVTAAGDGAPDRAPVGTAGGKAVTGDEVTCS